MCRDIYATYITGMNVVAPTSPSRLMKVPVLQRPSYTNSKENCTKKTQAIHMPKDWCDHSTCTGLLHALLYNYKTKTEELPCSYTVDIISV